MAMGASESRALHFPVEAEVPESKRHLELRTLLYQLLKLAFSQVAAVGCDQFVYWDATDPRACLAPDAFVRLGQPDDLFQSWKAWERGAPDVAVEIVSDSDQRGPDWREKLARYGALGVSELVRFDPDAKAQPLRLWDRVGAELVERQIHGASAQSRVLGGFWVVVEQPGTGLALRLSRDERGLELLPTPVELEARRADATAEALRGAERRVAELEAELKRRSRST
jgi:Uma2 family endonuclease